MAPARQILYQPSKAALPFGKPLLTAEWLQLALLNYGIAAATRRPLVPRGTELDSFDRKTFVAGRSLLRKYSSRGGGDSVSSELRRDRSALLLPP